MYETKEKEVRTLQKEVLASSAAVAICDWTMKTKEAQYSHHLIN